MNLEDYINHRCFRPLDETRVFYNPTFTHVMMKVTHENGHVEELGMWTVDELKDFGIHYNAEADKKAWELKKS